jgi:hypothetical protein
MSKNASTWIVIAIVALITIADTLSPKAFGLFWLGLSVLVFIFLIIFHYLDRKGKMY